MLIQSSAPVFVDEVDHLIGDQLFVAEHHVERLL
jgi:hypothetical protein